MLLFVMRGHASQPPLPDIPRSAGKARGYTPELLGAALFLCLWCVLRLLISRDTSRGVDAALAVSSLVIGVRIVVNCLRALHHGQNQ
jgi:hypothetical protein